MQIILQWFLTTAIIIVDIMQSMIQNDNIDLLNAYLPYKTSSLQQKKVILCTGYFKLSLATNDQKKINSVRNQWLRKLN